MMISILKLHDVSNDIHLGWCTGGLEEDKDERESDVLVFLSSLLL